MSQVSPSGWTTDEIGLQWLQNLFIPAINGCSTGKHHLLILDGYGSHLASRYNEICSQNDLIPICMAPYSSHLLQAYGCLAENKMQLGFNHIDTLVFPGAYPKAGTGAFKADTIKNSLAAAGHCQRDCKNNSIRVIYYA